MPMLLPVGAHLVSVVTVKGKTYANIVLRDGTPKTIRVQR